jgi:hypothetical protein
MGFIINCEEATAICNRNQYKEASIYDKIKLNFHVLMCKFCMSYTKQNNIMTRIFTKHLGPCDGSEHLSEVEKEKIHENLRKELEKK